MSGLHNSHPRVIASKSYVWTNISFKSAPFYETIGGSLSILLSNGCCWIKCQFCISIWFQLGTDGQYCVKKQDLCVLVRFLCCRADFLSSNTVYNLSCRNESFRVPSYDKIYFKLWNCSFKCCFRGVDSEKSKCFTIVHVGISKWKIYVSMYNCTLLGRWMNVKQIILHLLLIIEREIFLAIIKSWQFLSKWINYQGRWLQ